MIYLFLAPFCSLGCNQCNQSMNTRAVGHFTLLRVTVTGCNRCNPVTGSGGVGYRVTPGYSNPTTPKNAGEPANTWLVTGLHL